LRIPGNGETEDLIDITNNIWDFDAGILFDGDEDDTLGAGGSNLDDDEAFLAEAGLNNTVEDAGLTSIFSRDGRWIRPASNFQQPCPDQRSRRST